MNNPQSIEKSDRHKIYLWLFLGLLAILAGVRFSDGSMLLAISRGSTIEDQIFKAAAAQYVWDSPLKIIFLRQLPGQIIPIALFFLIIATLPVLGLLSKNKDLFFLALVSIFLTPAFKISLQNVGVGDGLIIFLIILAIRSASRWQIGFIFFLIALWHPQQSFFIGLSFVLARYFYSDKVDKQETIIIFGSLLFSAVVFYVYKSSLGFAYAGRESFMAQNVVSFLIRNIIYAPIAFLPSILWFLFVASNPVRGSLVLKFWLIILAVISLLTTDVTRVMTIISLPIVLMSSLRVLDKMELNFNPSWKDLSFAAIIALIPAYSWSGLDFLLWGDLIADFCKWRVYCL